MTLRLLPRARGHAHGARRLPRPAKRPATRSPRVVATGLLPGAMEIMDALAIEAAEAAVKPGYPGRARRC